MRNTTFLGYLEDLGANLVDFERFEGKSRGNRQTFLEFGQFL